MEHIDNSIRFYNPDTYFFSGVYHREHDDRNALTPGSIRRQSPPLASSRCPQAPDQRNPNNHHNGGIVMHVDLEHPRHHGQVGQHQQQRVGEELFLC